MQIEMLKSNGRLLWLLVATCWDLGLEVLEDDWWEGWCGTAWAGCLDNNMHNDFGTCDMTATAIVTPSFNLTRVIYEVRLLEVDKTAVLSR